MSKYANPHLFMKYSKPLLPWVGGLCTIMLVVGFVWSFYLVPPDYQQGGSVRIMFVHVPAAWLSQFVYASIAAASLVSLIWRHALADVFAKSAAPLGAAFTLLMLVTGSIWGKPMWGTWWEWDARLTSALILFFLYLGYIALWHTIENQQVAARNAAILALVGFINIPIIRFSVDWWNTLHQPASVIRSDGPSIDSVFLAPLLFMLVTYTIFFALMVVIRMRTEIMRRRLSSARYASAAFEESVA